MSIILELPAEIEESLSAAWGADVSRHILEAVAAEGYRQGVLSRGAVRKVLGLSFWEGEIFLKEHNCFVNYTVEDLEEDRRNLETVLGPVKRRELEQAVASEEAVPA